MPSGLEVCVAGPEADNGSAKSDNPINGPRNSAAKSLNEFHDRSAHFILAA